MGPDWWLLAGDGWLLILLPPFPPTSRVGRGWRGGGGGGGGGGGANMGSGRRRGVVVF